MSSKTDYLRKQIAKARRREKMSILIIVLGSLLILLGVYAGLIVKRGGAGGPYHPYIDLSIFTLIFGFLILAIGGGANTYYGWKRSKYRKQLTGMMHTSD